MSILHKAVYRFSAVPFKISLTFLRELEKCSKMYMKTLIHKTNIKMILNNKNKAERNIITDVKTYHSAVVTKSPWYSIRID